eukprot:gene7633-biopygen13606
MLPCRGPKVVFLTFPDSVHVYGPMKNTGCILGDRFSPMGSLQFAATTDVVKAIPPVLHFSTAPSRRAVYPQRSQTTATTAAISGAVTCVSYPATAVFACKFRGSVMFQSLVRIRTLRQTLLSYRECSKGYDDPMLSILVNTVRGGGGRRNFGTPRPAPQNTSTRGVQAPPWIAA